MNKTYVIEVSNIYPYYGTNFELITCKNFTELKNIIKNDYKFDYIYSVYDITNKKNLKGRIYK